MSSVRITPAGIAGTLLALAAVLLCGRLGIWQLDRHAERKTRNELIEERVELPVSPLEAGDGDVSELEYRRVQLEGEYDHARSIIWPGHAHHGSPGVHVLTPVRLTDESAVLVNRGWVHSPDAASIDLSELDVQGPVELIGLVRAFPEDGIEPDEATTAAREGRAIEIANAPEHSESAGFQQVWYRFDTDALRAQMPYPIAGFYVQALPAEGVSEPPVRLEIPPLDAGPHMGYALQWFSFGLIALIGWTVVAIRRRKAGGVEPSPVAAGRVDDGSS